MAISKSFFGLRRKSTKSLTFSVLNGKQITKDRVSAVKNPKSEAQAMQRMRFALLSVNLAAYRPILERSVESVVYGNQSVQYIMQKNMKSWKLQGYRKDSGFQPAEMQLAFGSLPGLNWEYGADEVEMKAEVGAIRNLEAPITIGKIRAAIGAEIGDQLTLVGAFSTGDPSNPYRAAWDSFYFTQELESVVVSQDEPVFNVSWLNGGINFGIGYQQNGLYVTTADGNTDPFVAFTTILSRDGDGKHLRSNAYFRCADLLGSSNANAIVTGRNTFMGISNLVSDWPVEATPVEHVVYTLGGKRYKMGTEQEPVYENVAILLKQTINGNTITTKEIGISVDGTRLEEAYEASATFPLQTLNSGQTWKNFADAGLVIPDEFVTQEVARGLVYSTR